MKTMTRAAVTLAVVIAAGGSVDAQRRTADGLIALAAGDYAGAVAILKPLAEADGGDQAAQFLMGTLYESGRGVPADSVRACALYMLATREMESPFGAQAQRLLRAMMQAHMRTDDRDWIEACQALSRIGFDHRFEPVTFELGRGQSIAWELKGATLTYEGRTTRAPMQLASRGGAFLPLQYTRLVMPGPSAAARHFIEVFVWNRGQNQMWALQWHLFEVVRDQVVRVADNDALATAAARPASDPSFDPHTLVSFRLNDAGQVEWRFSKF